MLNNLKMASKLSLGFGIILVLMLASGLISLNRMNIVNDQSTIIAENWMPSIKVTEEINTNTSDFRIAQYEHVLSTTEEDMKKAENSMDLVLATMKKNRADYEKLISSPEEQAVYDDFSKKFDKYMESHKQLLVVSRQNKTEEAQKILHNSEVLFDDFSKELLELVKINVDGGDKASATGDEIYAQAKILIISMIILSIILGVGAAFLITKSITSSLITFQEGLFSFFAYLNRESSNVQLIKLDSKDEFGNMAQIVNSNIQKTQKGY